MSVKGGEGSRQMLNGACTYRESRDTMDCQRKREKTVEQ